MFTPFLQKFCLPTFSKTFLTDHYVTLQEQCLDGVDVPMAIYILIIHVIGKLGFPSCGSFWEHF